MVKTWLNLDLQIRIHPYLQTFSIHNLRMDGCIGVHPSMLYTVLLKCICIWKIYTRHTYIIGLLHRCPYLALLTIRLKKFCLNLIW